MTSASLAPIAIFAYKRTRHLAQVLDALELCPEFKDSPVFVFSDGPRNLADVAEVEVVRDMIRARLRANMTLIEASQNKGLAASIIAGVTKLCNGYGKVIVIEDDLLVAPCTLTWFNCALEKLSSATHVWQISAHQFPVRSFARRRGGVLINLSSSWGWATWKRAWDNFDPNGTGWEVLKSDPALRRRFDLDNSYPYHALMLRQMSGQTDSWAIRWWWVMFRAGALGLFPPRSLVSNIGLDETATHSAFGRLKGWLVPAQCNKETVCPEVPESNTVDSAAETAVRKAIRRMWWPTRIRAYLQALFYGG